MQRHTIAAVVTSKALSMAPSYRACLTYMPNVLPVPVFSIDGVADRHEPFGGVVFVVGNRVSALQRRN
jgi:hypothetical protein